MFLNTLPPGPILVVPSEFFCYLKAVLFQYVMTSIWVLAFKKRLGFAALEAGVMNGKESHSRVPNCIDVSRKPTALIFRKFFSTEDCDSRVPITLPAIHNSA